MPIMLAHRVAAGWPRSRKGGTLPFLRPDGKSQVTVEYDADGRPRRVHTVLVSTQHDPDVDLTDLAAAVREQVVEVAIPAELLDDDTRHLVNPTGRFVIGGPMGDSGLSGRKIIVDTYGGMARHGGGSFSGKDPTKVDRSGAYMARYVAKNVVAAGLARRCELQLAYAIGVAHPLAINVQTFGTGSVADARLVEPRRAHLRPASRGDHPRPRPAPADLPADRRLRPLRARRPRPALGAHRPRRRPARAAGAVGRRWAPA